jgi:hypothetical protein
MRSMRGPRLGQGRFRRCPAPRVPQVGALGDIARRRGAGAEPSAPILRRDAPRGVVAARGDAGYHPSAVVGEDRPSMCRPRPEVPLATARGHEMSGRWPSNVPSPTCVGRCAKERSTAVGVKPRSGLRLVQPVQTIVPVTVPVSVASGKLTGLPEMVQLTGPGAADFEATLVKVPNGEVKVRSKLTGTNRAR